MVDATDKHKAQIISYFKTIPKTPKSDPSKMKIDWLIDIKELETTGVDDKSVAMDDMSIGSFGSQSFFSTTQSQNQDYYLQGDTHQSLAPREEDPIQNTTVAFAQSSQSVEGYGMPSALT